MRARYLKLATILVLCSLSAMLGGLLAYGLSRNDESTIITNVDTGKCTPWEPRGHAEAEQPTSAVARDPPASVPELVAAPAESPDVAISLKEWVNLRRQAKRAGDAEAVQKYTDEERLYYDSVLERQYRDNSWAAETEDSLRVFMAGDSAVPGVELLDVVCASSFCRAKVELTEPGAFDNLLSGTARSPFSFGGRIMQMDAGGQTLAWYGVREGLDLPPLGAYLGESDE